jgi:hypothetical protein
MNSHNTADDSEPSVEAGGQPTNVDVVDWTSLSGFQRDLLVSLTRTSDPGKPPSGRELKEDVERRYGERVNHSRLYKNLDRLEARGLVEKSFHDGRTNAYYVTDEGVQLLRVARDMLTAVV